MTDSSGGRLRREIDHHRQIAPRAEVVWNWDSPAGRLRVERRARLLAQAVELKPTMLALELGCGTGLFLEKVSSAGAVLHGIDLTLELLRKARERLRNTKSVYLECGNAERLPFADATFDAIYGSSILHHLHLDVVLCELLRVLKPAGRIAFAEPNLLNPQNFVTFHVPFLRAHCGFSPDEMAFTRFHCARLLRRSGFDQVSVRPYDFLHPSIPARCLPVASIIARLLERIPVVREIAGSILLSARKPRAPSGQDAYG